MKILPARDVYDLTDEAQTQIIWSAILSTYYATLGNNVLNQPAPMGDPDYYYVSSFNFKASPGVVTFFQNLGYTMQLSDPQPPQFVGPGNPNRPVTDADSWITNGQDITGHTTVSWNVGPKWPLYNWVSGSGLSQPTYQGTP